MSLSARAGYAPEAVTLHAADLSWGEARAHADGIVGLSRGQQLDVRFSVDALAVPSLLAVAGQDPSRAQGQVWASGTASGTTSAPDVIAQVQARQLAVAGEALGQAHVTMARSCGIAGPRLFFCYVFPSALEPMIALAGVTITLAAGASIPVEALADSPGLGQLTWRSALGRDMALLVSTTLLLAALTISANLICDAALLRLKVRRT